MCPKGNERWLTGNSPCVLTSNWTFIPVMTYILTQTLLKLPLILNIDRQMLCLRGHQLRQLGFIHIFTLDFIHLTPDDLKLSKHNTVKM